MRLLPVLLALPLLAFQAHAQSAAPQQAAPPPGPAAATAPSAPAAATSQHHQRMTWKQRFAQANLAHDGHLTMQEASGGYPSLAKHFKDIDADNKGYVTEEDVTNWHKLQRATHHSTRNTTGDALRPRPAIQRGLAAPQPLKTTTNRNVLPMAQPDAASAGQEATTR